MLLLQLNLVVRVLQLLVFLGLRGVVLVYDFLVEAVERGLLRLELRQLQFWLLLFKLFGQWILLPRGRHLNFWENEIFIDYVWFWLFRNIMLNFLILELFV